jgi:hypothetical protein
LPVIIRARSERASRRFIEFFVSGGPFLLLSYGTSPIFLEPIFLDDSAARRP